MENEENTRDTGRPRSPELVRPVEGRVVAGVAAGVASRYGLTPWVVRALFVVLAFFGGLGLALYLAGWAVLRSEDEADSPAERFFGNASSSTSWIGIFAIFIAALLLLDNLTFLSGGVIWAGALLVVGVLLYMGQIPIRPRDRVDAAEEPGIEVSPATQAIDVVPATTPPPPRPAAPTTPPKPVVPRERSMLGRLTIGLMILSLGVLALLDNSQVLAIDATPRHYLALAVTVLGIGLLVGSVLGRARWLILVAVVMVPTLLFSPVFEYEWTSERFEAVISPTSFSELDDTYVMDVGSLVIDLTGLPWNGQTIDIQARVDAGNLEIWIPAGVGADGMARVDVGRVSVLGAESFGFGDPHLAFEDSGPLGTGPLGIVHIDAMVEVGNIEIYRP